MNIEDFVSESLVQITKGVISAQRQLDDTKALVNPLMRTISEKHKIAEAEMRSGHVVSFVEFDMAVTATKDKETKGGIGVVAGVFTLGSVGKSDAASGSESRIKFSVPLLLPTHKDYSELNKK